MSPSIQSERERLQELHRECLMLVTNLADAETRLQEILKKTMELETSILNKLIPPKKH